MAYAILRFKKHPRGTISHMENHDERKKEKYKSNPDVDTSRSEQNYHLVEPSGTYHKEINKRIKEAGCKVRKDSVLMIETLITASHEFMKELDITGQKAFFEHALEFIKAEFGEQNIFTAVVHMDETTPHMHLCFTPITKDNRLTAKVIMGGPKELSEWQDRFHAHMSAKYPELERGVPASESKRKHIPVHVFKQAKRLEAQMEEIRQAVSDITMFNQGKKREEALELLSKWLPSADSFTRAISKNKEYIETLEEKAKVLEEQVDSKTEKMDEIYGELMTMKELARKQRDMLDRLPPEVREEIKHHKKQQKEMRR